MARQTNPKLLADFFNKIGRLCCKTRKLQRQEFFAKTRSGRRSPIRIPSVAVPKSPVSLTREDQSPHVFTRKTRPQPAEFLITRAKRLLQHNRPISDILWSRHSPVPAAHGAQRRRRLLFETARHAAKRSRTRGQASLPFSSISGRYLRLNHLTSASV